MDTVKAHAGTPKVTPHKVHLKNLANYTGPKHSSGKPAVHAHVKTDNPTAISSPKDLI